MELATYLHSLYQLSNCDQLNQHCSRLTDHYSALMVVASLSGLERFTDLQCYFSHTILSPLDENQMVDDPRKHHPRPEAAKHGVSSDANSDEGQQTGRHSGQQSFQPMTVTRSGRQSSRLGSFSSTFLQASLYTCVLMMGAEHVSHNLACISTFQHIDSAG